MKKSLYLLAIISLVLFCQAVDISNCLLTYQETTGKEQTEVVISIKETDKGFLIATKDEQSEVDKKFRTISYIMNPSTSDNVVITNSPAGIKISQNGETSQSKIDGYWYQTMYNMKDFIESVEDKREFVLFSDYSEKDAGNTELKPLELILKKKGIEIIKVNNIDTRAFRIIMTIPGWKSVFWSTDYWYREADGILVKARIVKGGSGTSETILQLKSEKHF